jgi:hypothetical protein
MGDKNSRRTPDLWGLSKDVWTRIYRNLVVPFFISAVVMEKHETIHERYVTALRTDRSLLQPAVEIFIHSFMLRPCVAYSLHLLRHDQRAMSDF